MRSARRVSAFVDDLLRNRRPRRFRASPDELEAMRAAVRLRSARTGADLPDPTFVDRLGRRLRRELTGEERAASLSRRRLLAGAGTAAAAAIVGAVGALAGDRIVPGLERPPAGELVPAGATWQPVAAAADVPDGWAMRFSTGAVEGYVVNSGGRFHAVSAVCTHLGCILQNAGNGRLTCPCHRTAFTTEGAVAYHELPQAPRDLPRIRTRVRAGQVEVFTA
jgi:nitrite reductase/ring-hydroxylating ferredoxin subunit